MSRVLTIESIAACAAFGHRWRWVETWGDCGFEECECCGESRRHGQRTVGEVAAEARVQLLQGLARAVADEVDASLMAHAAKARPGRPRKAARDARILQRLAAGASLTQVGAEFHLDPSRICQIKKQHERQKQVAHGA